MRNIRFLYPIFCIFWSIAILIFSLTTGSIIYSIFLLILFSLNIFKWYVDWKRKAFSVTMIQAFLDLFFMGILSFFILQQIPFSNLISLRDLPLGILAWFVLAMLLIILVYNLYFIYLISAKGQVAAQEKFISPTFKKAQQAVFKAQVQANQQEAQAEKKVEPTIEYHSLKNHCIFVQIDDSLLKIKDAFKAAIVNLDIIKSKVDQADYLVALEDKKVIGIYEIKERPFIEITNENILSLQNKLAITDLKVGHVVMNVKKQTIAPKELANIKQKKLDFLNKPPIFYNF